MNKLMLAWLALIIFFATPAHPQQPRYDDLANLPFRQDYPTDEMTQMRMAHSTSMSVPTRHPAKKRIG
jgi:hypothetical protein